MSAMKTKTTTKLRRRSIPSTMSNEKLYRLGWWTIGHNRKRAERMMAFWSYDQFPYVLHSPVSELLHDGRVRVRGYGGMTVTPCLLIPMNTGTVLAGKLDALECAKQNVLDTIRDAFEAQLKQISPWNPRFKKVLR